MLLSAQIRYEHNIITLRAITYMQLFRERLSEKVHATIPKGIVGGFKFSVL